MSKAMKTAESILARPKSKRARAAGKILMRTNENGLSYAFWLAAANKDPSPSMRAAWKRGEDPSDYRALRRR